MKGSIKWLTVLSAGAALVVALTPPPAECLAVARHLARLLAALGVPLPAW